MRTNIKSLVFGMSLALMAGSATVMAAPGDTTNPQMPGMSTGSGSSTAGQGMSSTHPSPTERPSMPQPGTGTGTDTGTGTGTGSSFK